MNRMANRFWERCATRQRPPFAIRLKQPRGNLFGQNRKLPCGCFNRMANGGRFLVAQRSRTRFAIRVIFLSLGPFRWTK